MATARCVQEVAELERRLDDQLAVCDDAERRVERAELAVMDVQEQLHRSQQDAVEQRERAQQQLDADHRQVRALLQ